MRYFILFFQTIRLPACLIAVSMILLISACTTRVFKIAHPALQDGRYDSEFPYVNSSEQLEEIANTLKKITSTAYYKSYVFPVDARLTDESVAGLDLEANSIQTIFYNESTYGTATVFYKHFRSIALLTCAHIIDFPDTVITYYIPEDRVLDDENYIQLVSVKTSQQYYINDLPEGGDLAVLAIDAEKDIALLGKKFFNAIPDVTVFEYPFGDSKQLEWGSFVYMLGYPMGNRMVTRGIVSKSHQDDADFFLADALFNRGSSGGIILAVRDGIPNFELVGITRAVSSNSDYYVVPSKEMDEIYYEPHVPYSDDLFIQKKSEINYGITYTVSVGDIREFLQEHQNELKKQGYHLENRY